MLPNCVLSSGSGWSFRVMKGCRLLGSCLSGVKRVTVDCCRDADIQFQVSWSFSNNIVLHVCFCLCSVWVLCCNCEVTNVQEDSTLVCRVKGKCCE